MTTHSAGITREALEAALDLSITNAWTFLGGRATNVVVSGASSHLATGS